jgi:hypothetical protein
MKCGFCNNGTFTYHSKTFGGVRCVVRDV